jgi:hypothetical protein
MRRRVRRSVVLALAVSGAVAAASPAGAAPTPQQRELARLAAALPSPAKLGVPGGRGNGLSKAHEVWGFAVCSAPGITISGFPSRDSLDQGPGTRYLARTAKVEVPGTESQDPPMRTDPLIGQEMVGVFKGSAPALMRRAAKLCPSSYQGGQGAWMVLQSVKRMKARAGWTAVLNFYTYELLGSGGSCETRSRATAARGHDVVQFSLSEWNSACDHVYLERKVVALMNAYLAKLH